MLRQYIKKCSPIRKLKSIQLFFALTSVLCIYYFFKFPIKDHAYYFRSSTSSDLAKKSFVKDIASIETWPMQEQFYTSTFSAHNTSTTIILNVFDGPEENLKVQLNMALYQKHVEKPQVWVTCFGSKNADKYEQTAKEFMASTNETVYFTRSNFNFKYHGRFLLAYMASTKYVLFVDDDRKIITTLVHDFIELMKKKRGVWGNKGHLRSETFEGYKSWPGGYNDEEFAEQDYLSGMWFIEQRWLEYFFKERIPTWTTGEDMHLSHTLRKYLNLDTFGGTRMEEDSGLHKTHQSTVGSALHLREFLFDHQLGRGNQVASVRSPIQTLVYAETVDDITDYIEKIQSCTNKSVYPWCSGGKTAVVFRGEKEQDVVGIIKKAIELCKLTKCGYYAVKPRIKHIVQYFNMRQSFGQYGEDPIPYQTQASDLLVSLVGVLHNVSPTNLFVPDVENRIWKDTETMRARLQIYHSVVMLAVKIHENTKRSNGKQEGLQAINKPADVLDDEGFPILSVYMWRHSSEAEQSVLFKRVT